QQRCAGRQPCAPAQVLERDDISASAARICAYRLPVRCGHDNDEQRDHPGDGKGVVEVVRAGEQQDEKNLLGRVGARRERVGREDRERFELREALLGDPRSRERTPKNDALYRLDEPLEAASRPAADLGGRNIPGRDRLEAQLAWDDPQIRRTRGGAVPNLAQLDPKWGLRRTGALVPRDDNALGVVPLVEM